MHLYSRAGLRGHWSTGFEGPHLLAAPSTRDSRPRRLTANGAHAHYTFIGSAVVDLMRSIAKREVTFFNGTVAIKFL